jgi:glycosyltransferase involved in cell wall biosynthesis
MVIAVNARFLIKDKLEGIGWFTHEVLKKMVIDNPNDTFIFLFDRKYDSTFIFRPNVIPYVVYPPARRSFLWYYWFEWGIPRILNKVKPDVFFSPDGFLSLRLKIPQLLVMHDLAYLHYPKQIPFLARTYYQYFVPKYLHKAEHVFCVSEATKNDIIQHFKIQQEKLSVAYNGLRSNFKKLIDSEKARVRDKYSSGEFYFLFVGALHPRKNVHTLMEGFDLYKKQNSNNTKLIIVGRKAFMTNEMNKAYDNCIYKKDILFYSYMGTEELALLTASAIASINPSFLEGFGVPVLEALQCGVPVIVSGRFSLPEIGGPGAYIINPESSASICDAMEMVTNEKIRDLENRISLGFEHSKKFSWDTTSHHIYKTLLQYR